uniref:AP-3 complex subunit delta n=1 Tax=Mesocestoides corti TaxID=53468 RepID=A0A5K3FKE5_MESCO
MNKILRHHPKSVQAHKDLILACLEDKDESIRLRALDLLHGMVTKTNLIEIVKSLVRHLNSPDIGNYFRSELISTIVRICSQENYHYVVSFEWYVSVLIELAQLNTNRTGELLANQLLDVAVRVASVRQFAVGQMAIFLRSCKSMMTHSNQASLHDVIYAAAWICGEYAGFLEEPRETLEAMLETASFIDLPGHIQSVLVLNCLKLYCKLVAAWFAQTTGGCDVLSDPPPPPPESIDASADLRALVDRLLELTAFLMDKISLFVHSANLEAQERAVSIHQLLHLVVKRLTKLRATASTSPLPQPPPPPPTSTCGGGGGGGGDEDVVDLLGIDADDSLDPLSAVRKTASAADDAPTPATDSTQPPPSSDLLNGVHGVLVELGGLFAGEVHPVAAKAQRKVPLPEGLDLDAWINEPPPPPKLTLASPSSLLPTDAPLDRHKKRSKKGVIGESATGGIFSGLVEPEGPKPVKLTQAELDEVGSK